MNIVWEYSPYKGVTRLVHLALADNSNDAGECHPHLPNIIQRARSSRTAVYRALAQMGEEGWLNFDGERIDKPSREHPLVLAVPGWDSPVPNLDCPVPSWDQEADHTSLVRTTIEPSSRAASPAVTSVTLEQDFEYWWSLCPKKVGKGAARSKYLLAVKKVGVERLNEAMRAYAASRKHQEAQYTLNPATWLNQERWDDEVRPLRVVDEEYERAWAKAHGREEP